MLFCLQNIFYTFFFVIKCRFTNKICTFVRIMETGTKLIEELIAAVME